MELKPFEVCFDLIKTRTVLGWFVFGFRVVFFVNVTFLLPFLGRLYNLVLYTLLTRFIACCATLAGMIHMSPTTQGLH